MTKALVNKLLHHPSPSCAGWREEDVEGISVESVQKLFGVEPESDENPPGPPPDESD